MSSKDVGGSKQLDKAKNALFFSNVGFWILAIVYFLLGPVNVLLFLSNLNNPAGALMIAAFFTVAVCGLGSAPIVMAVGLSVIALIRPSTLPSADERKVLWQSGSILLAIPVTAFVGFCLYFVGWFDNARTLLVSWTIMSVILMVFVIVPIVKTRQDGSTPKRVRKMTRK